MAKSFKYKNNNYLDSTGIVHNRKILADIIYPVGSIYISVNNTNPSTYYGGTWVQIKDRFLLACGNTYSNGATGGEASHTLTNDEIPSHNHAIRVAVTNGGNAGNYRSAFATNSDWWAGENNYDWNNKTNNIGGGQAHNNMPPYLAVYVWKRTA